MAYRCFCIAAALSLSIVLARQDDNMVAESSESIDFANKIKRESKIVDSTPILNLLKPVPIVDTITEEEKYGNSGDKFNAFGRSIVGGVEKLSNAINSLINLPLEAVKKVSRSTTEALNNLGGKLVGLQ